MNEARNEAPGGLLALAETCERVGATTKRLEKLAILAAYFRSAPASDAKPATIFLSGRVFPAADETTLKLGGAILWRAVQSAAGADEKDAIAAYRTHGDLGAAAFDLFSSKGRGVSARISVADLQRALSTIAASKGPAPKQRLLEELLAKTSPLEAKYVVKIITSDLRIGSKESLVEEAVARAFDREHRDLARANMLLGDLGAALELAREDKLRGATLRLFHPIGFMLASPAKNAEDAMRAFAARVVEDKFDGIRAQAHVGGAPREVKLYSRTRDEVTASFPELIPALLAFSGELLLDGEILAWDSARGRAMSFGALQKRLGRKRPSEELQREIPVAFVVFDVLYRDGELTMDEPLARRREALDAIFAARGQPPENTASRGQLDLFGAAPRRAVGALLLAPVFSPETTEDLDRLFVDARARGNEGLMVKELSSPYAVGKRGKQWLKVKRELATLDVVVTGVEWGHGKRVNVLSDVTFAVRDGDRLLDIGKAYSGLTDAEIAETTSWFLDHTLEDRGFYRSVEPTMVLEVAFDRIMKSERHASGYALRFPRIVRIRSDKPASEADDMEAVKRIFDAQG